tara:strand:+ start:483 stop:665 length:183 start_codon:yes stop_codon:yes gene_type:complete
MIFDKQMDKSNNSGEEKYTNISLKLSSKFIPKLEQLKKEWKIEKTSEVIEKLLKEVLFED